MAGLSLRGPSKQGSHELDEGALTSAVVDSYGVDNGASGPEAAAKVLPARRELWRLAEAYHPKALAASLRTRLSTSDQTGRGGVRELRKSLADWLDPAPRCARCAAPMDTDTAGKPCPSAHQRVRSPANKGMHPAPTYCVARRGKPSRIAGRAYSAVGRDGTLALFSPVQLDPTSAAAVKMLKHSKSSTGMAYDLAVDRDARILLAATAPNVEPLHPRVARARLALDRAVNAAIKANGRLILKVQTRYFSAKGQVTRADLVQGGAMGCRRALMDFDPGLGWRFSTYAANWIYQGIGEVFAGRDVVSVPDWVIALRRQVEDLGLVPGYLLSLIGTVAATRGDAAACEEAAEALVDALPPATEDVANFFPAVRACVDAATTRPAGATADIGDDRARERVAAWAGLALGLDIGAGKPCTGSALLAALRHGAAVLVPVGTGERDDHDAEEGAGNASRPPAHLRDTDDDPETAVAEEMAAASQWRSLLAALETLRLADPEAAEVIRRRHALDDLGEGETLEEIASMPMRCAPHRQLCRESIRKAYERGRKAIRRALGATASATLFDGPQTADTSAVPAEEEWQAPVPRRPHGPLRPRRPASTITTFASPPPAAPLATAEDFTAWGEAMSDAAMMF